MLGDKLLAPSSYGDMWMMLVFWLKHLEHEPSLDLQFSLKIKIIEFYFFVYGWTASAPCN
jgi:hypothetical protein